MLNDRFSACLVDFGEKWTLTIVSSSTSDENYKEMLEKGNLEIQQDIDKIVFSVEDTRRILLEELDSINSMMKTNSTQNR